MWDGESGFKAGTRRTKLRLSYARGDILHIMHSPTQRSFTEHSLPKFCAAALPPAEKEPPP